MQCNRCKTEVSFYKDTKDPLKDYEDQPKTKLILCDVCFSKRAKYLKEAKEILDEVDHLNVSFNEGTYEPDYPRPFEEIHLKIDREKNSFNREGGLFNVNYKKKDKQ